MAPNSPPPADDDVLTVVVGSRGTTYVCPDIPTLDGHLAALCVRIRQTAALFPNLARAFREDVDVLLDRRRWLELTAARAA